MTPHTIWANPFLTEPSEKLLKEGVAAHLLLLAEKPEHVLAVGTADRRLLEAEIIFGQPDPEAMMQSRNVRWVHISSAGYTRYDTNEFRAALRDREAILTNSSNVYDGPCAEHLLGWLLADARQLYPSYDNQREEAGWPQNDLRGHTRLLADQTILIAGYGAIGRRLADLLSPFPVEIVGFRRKPQPDPKVQVIGESELSEALGKADHIINILPDSPLTRHFFDTHRFRQLKPGACFYSIGRGTTTDQDALQAHLESGHLRAAYLDVTEPEPLPPGHALWRTKNCYITPHTGGGHFNETEKIVEHFLHNLRRFEEGRELLNVVFA